MISKYLSEYFKTNNITQLEIQKRTGIEQCKLSLILSNKRKLSAEELLKIAIEFDINLEELKKEIIKSTNLK